jgi:acetyltransferase-like isoleucine patch superfamily enzyme
MRQALSLIKYQLGRARNVWWGRDEAVLRRLQRKGKVVYGPGTYGIPTIHDFPHSKTRLIVGNYSSIGGHYLLGGQHSIEHVSTWPMRINFGLPGAGEDGVPVPRDDIRVGSDCWTTYGTWIQGGVTIGDGAVVATGAVVTKDVPPFAIVGGIPARVIGYRHTEEQREALLEIRWWDWPEEEIRAAVPYLASTDIDAFIEYARSRQNREPTPRAELTVEPGAIRP